MRLSKVEATDRTKHMRISKRPSGGRGEYEIARPSPGELRPTELLNRYMQLQFGSQTIKTGLALLRQGGKNRLRSPEEEAFVQVQTAIMLMLPQPQRDEKVLLPGLPVLQNERYIIKHLYLSDVALVEPDAFQALVRVVEYGNQSHQAEQIDVLDRMQGVEQLWRKRSTFPPDVSRLLATHERLIRLGGPLPESAEGIITELQLKMKIYAPDLDVTYSPNTDIVPVMLNVLKGIVEERPSDLNQIEPEQIELRRREVKKWQQWASHRGAASAKFKRVVREAYDFQCVMCGSRFPPTSLNVNPGVDAAHILPWADYDLDETHNGLTLCKLHHWAFDEHLLTIVYRDSRYHVELLEEAEAMLYPPVFSIDVLREVEGEIPDERLPVRGSDRPHPLILARLNGEPV